ncbi:MAG: prephenate dehydrogenase/arogenate dehydrogenase family protein [Pirellulales bacterium]|nr:prephenate dehydrogenase/arogenate dehydrogenase family protein [Pirellulales bacterium]
MPTWKTVAIVGVGLIGGSIGLALRDRKLAKDVVGIGRRAASLRKAKSLGAITATARTIEQGAREADVAIVCTPVGAISEHVLQVAAACSKKTLITDAGSTKAAIVSKVESRLPEGRRFVGSHPLAGSEKSGAAFARADLFEGRVVVVTPSKQTVRDDAQAIGDFWSGLGATVLFMSPEAHDKELAGTSHVPHLIAAAVAASTQPSDLPLVAAGWRDLTRIAAGDPELWRQILLENQTHVLKSLSRFEKTIGAFRTALERGDRRKLLQLLTEGKSIRDALGN